MAGKVQVTDSRAGMKKLVFREAIVWVIRNGYAETNPVFSG